MKTADVFETITASIIEALERPSGDWIMPWRRKGTPLALPMNALSQRPYSGINIVALWVAAHKNGFASSQWATYRQWHELGAQVRSGARGNPVVFYKTYTVEPDPTREDDDGARRTARSFTVFNADQVEGYHDPGASAEGERPLPLRIEACDRFVAATGAKIRHGGDRAFYSPASDHIQMPDASLFTGSPTMTAEEAYAATLLHECAHWSGGKGRLERDLSTRFGTAAYAAEELLAEIAASVLMAELKITADLRPDHVQYIESWLKLLKNDKRAIFTAAAKAAEAVAFLKGFGKTQTVAQAA
ncbi:DUF1738 domain-containing protein [Rhodomicrobium vannielii ATCC 17100]|uniref:ArdC family protein n=1 Tax=Rhodomicrobium vannielii TaxID=1069 RepID=UPI0019183401|nr:zincin-like metallopeptidase domain-containing protein [Rhodomicrobium vannielii]MBJ7532951.1 DUF1738 domain-containing protein [Rhodomicrobium vannielii ATCC 17100]